MTSNGADAELMTYIIILGDGEKKKILPYCSSHFLRQVSTVELGYPLNCDSIQDGRQIKTSAEEPREGSMAVGEEQIPKSIRNVLVLNFSQGFS